MAVVVLIIVAFVLTTTACTSTTDESGAAVTDGERLSATVYPTVMGDICSESDVALAQLPPPEESGQAEWVDAVALVLLDEAAAFDVLFVSDSRRSDHLSFVVNTEQQAAEWANLAAALRNGDSEALAASTDEIAALTLGRNDLAAEMGLDGCQERQIGG